MNDKLVPDGFEKYVSKAVQHYWKTLKRQSKKQASGDADRGARAAVTGGKQMDGFCQMISWLLLNNGLSEANIYSRGEKVIPGFFRPTKDWDLIVICRSHLIAAIEFKSQKGPSFGNNFNNRTEEALGNAVDLWTAFREMAYGEMSPKPWLGWVMLVEDCKKSQSPVKVSEPHFKVFPEFNSTSYAMRYQILLRKLVVEKMYDQAALILSNEKKGLRGEFIEPTPELSIKRFLASLAAHARSYLESI